MEMNRREFLATVLVTTGYATSDGQAADAATGNTWGKVSMRILKEREAHLQAMARLGASELFNLIAIVKTSDAAFAGHQLTIFEALKRSNRLPDGSTSHDVVATNTAFWDVVFQKERIHYEEQTSKQLLDAGKISQKTLQYLQMLTKKRMMMRALVASAYPRSHDCHAHR